MGKRKTDCTKLLFCLLHLLTEETKRKTSYLKENNVMDGVLHSMLKRGLLPDWFKRYFYGYNPLYGVLNGLTDLFINAMTLDLIRYDFSVFSARIIINLNYDLCNRFLSELEVGHDQVKELVHILEEELLRGEAEHRERMSQSPVHAYGHYL